MWLFQIQTYGRLIKFSHTIFALPFALAAVVLAHCEYPLAWSTLAWIIIAMAGARSAAMGFNRLVDIRYDRLNPRTADRPSVTGRISRKAIIYFILISSLVFIISAANLGKLCFFLSFPCLLFLFSYSYTKRFTSFSHIYLGLAIGLAPLGAWIAVTGGLRWSILLLSVALMTYIAGFDILYACQDVEFDRKMGLYSLPARWGIKPALAFSSFLHVITFISLGAIYLLFKLGSIYLASLVLIGVLLILEHKLADPADPRRMEIAFFHVNGAISVLLFLGIWLDSWF